MRFGWDKAVLAVTLAATLASCDRTPDAAGPDLAEAQKAADFFMQSNARADGVHVLPSGLQYKVVKSGPAGGPQPDRNDLVNVNYEGTLTDGTVFDSSFDRGAPYVTTPDDVVPGWTEALQLMKPGDEWILYVPPALGYAEKGGGSDIPPNAVLIFRLQMLDVAKVPGGARGVGSANG